MDGQTTKLPLIRPATPVRNWLKYVNGKSLGKTAINDPGKNLIEHTFVRNLNQLFTQMKSHCKRCSCEVWRGNQMTKVGIWNHGQNRVRKCPRIVCFVTNILQNLTEYLHSLFHFLGSKFYAEKSTVNET
jgi:hypothetical protein